jgi:hypothetical protein
MTRIDRLTPDTRRGLAQEVASPVTPEVARARAVATLRMYARMEPGQRIDQRERDAARTALRWLGEEW